MKKSFLLGCGIATCMMLTACGANSLFEAEMEELKAEPRLVSSDKATIPAGCTSWFDGCNLCMVTDGKIGGCTKMACKSTKAEPQCRKFAPGFGEEVKASVAPADQGNEQAPESMPEVERKVSADVPKNCKIWFDGCNSCVVLGGKLRGCTSKVCTTMDQPSCVKGE